MGIKQYFFTELTQNVADRPLCEVWSDRPAGGSQVLVVDGANFIAGMLQHVQLGTGSPAVPRLQEFREVLRLVLRGICESCPGVEFHIIFDGASSDAVLESKDAERSRRQRQRIAETAVHAASFSQAGYCKRASAWSGGVLRRCLLDVVRSLEGQHRVFFAHGASRDLDMCMILHASENQAKLLLSDDSDFLAAFHGVVLLIRSLRFARGKLQSKAVSLAYRLRTLGLDSSEELLIAAFLGGSDFNSPIIEGTWQEIAQTTRRIIADCPSWQAAILEASQDKTEGQSFIDNFDIAAYTPNHAEDGTESWTCQGVAAYGITQIHPPSSALDVILRGFAKELPDQPDTFGSSPVRAARLLQAYSQGQLSARMLNLLRFRTTGESPGLADHVAGRPVATWKRGALERIAAFLARPQSDSWDDDEDGHDASYLAVAVETFHDEVFGICTQTAQEVAELERVARQTPSLNSGKEADLKMQELLRRVLAVETISTSERVRNTELPSWVWEGAVLPTPQESENQRKARAESFFFLATGKTLPKPYLALVTKCVSVDALATPAEQNSLLLLAVASMGGEQLVPEQMRQLQKSLGIDKQDFSVSLPAFAGRSQAQHAGAAIVLGELCWWLLSHLQDVHCLCGGQGFIFSGGVPLAGGPIVVTQDGLVHKAKDGYRVRLNGPPDEEVPEEVLDDAARFLFDFGTVRRIKDWFKLTDVGPVDAFALHRRVLVLRDLPYTLSVKALS